MDKKRLKDKFFTLINKRYPNWKGFTDERYIGDEREYKLKAVQLAQDLLSKQRLMELVEKREFDTIIENIKKEHLTVKPDDIAIVFLNNRIDNYDLANEIASEDINALKPFYMRLSSAEENRILKESNNEEF